MNLLRQAYPARTAAALTPKPTPSKMNLGAKIFQTMRCLHEKIWEVSKEGAVHTFIVR
jgi:hypothetical protein